MTTPQPSAAPLPSLGSLHDEQVLALLRSGQHPQLLGAYFGEAEYRELCQLATQAAARNASGPRVYILPGIMGSKLASARRKAVDLLWLHPAAVSDGKLL